MWKVEYSKKFLKELSTLSKTAQARIKSIVFHELKTKNPFELGYLNKLKGYKDKYKIRVGDYRIGVTVKKSSQTIICQRVAHRQEIYKIFP